MSHYADHQEYAAQHLRDLLAGDLLPSPSAADTVLECRAIIWAELQTRIRDLGQPRQLDTGPTHLPVQLRTLPTQGPALLGQLIDSRSRRTESQQRPSEVLEAGTRSYDTAASSWASAAGAMIVGTHALQEAEDRPWLTDPGAAWYVLGDIAQTSEALIVLDGRLQEVGILELPTPTPRSSLMTNEEGRIIAHQVSQASAWYSTNRIADLAQPTPVTARLEAAQSQVRMIKEPADLAPAQRRLADLARRMEPKDFSFAGEPRLSAWDIQAIAKNQLHVNSFLTETAAAAPRLGLEGHLTETRQLLMPVIERSITLYTPESETTGQPQRTHPAIWQQHEIGNALRKFTPSQMRALTDMQLVELVTATHDVTTSFAKNAHAELLRDDTTIRRKDVGRVVGPTREHNGSPLSKALKNLRDQEPPVTTPVRWPVSSSRDALKSTLQDLPLGERPPSPFIRHPRPRGYSR